MYGHISCRAVDHQALKLACLQQNGVSVHQRRAHGLHPGQTDTPVRSKGNAACLQSRQLNIPASYSQAVDDRGSIQVFGLLLGTEDVRKRAPKKRFPVATAHGSIRINRITLRKISIRPKDAQINAVILSRNMREMHPRLIHVCVLSIFSDNAQRCT